MLAQAEEELPLPESVQGIIAARLDTLPPDEKGLVQAAAIVGKVFWPGALGELLGLSQGDVEQAVHALERKEFVRRERRSSVAGETAYVFRHVLVRDVAYSQIPRKRRADMHRLAAGWIEALAGDRPEDLADMVAHHYLSALDLDRRSGREDPELTARVRTALVEAGDRSSALNAFPTAARFYEQALELSHGEGRGQATRAPRLRTGSLPRRGQRKGRLARGGRRIPGGRRERSRQPWPWSLWRTSFISSKGIARKRARTSTWPSHSSRTRPPSPVKAGVLANRARFHMISDETDQAIRTCRRGPRARDEAGARGSPGAHAQHSRRGADAERRLRRRRGSRAGGRNRSTTLVRVDAGAEQPGLDSRGARRSRARLRAHGAAPSRQRADTAMSLRWRGSRRSSSTGSTGSVSGSELLSRAERDAR